MKEKEILKNVVFAVLLWLAFYLACFTIGKTIFNILN